MFLFSKSWPIPHHSRHDLQFVDVLNFMKNNVTSYIRHPAIFSAQDLACLVFLRRSRWPFTARGRYTLAATSYGSRNPMVGRTGSGRECGECRWIMLNHYVDYVFIVFYCTIVAFLLFTAGFLIAILYPLSLIKTGRFVVVVIFLNALGATTWDYIHTQKMVQRRNLWQEILSFGYVWYFCSTR